MVKVLVKVDVTSEGGAVPTTRQSHEFIHVQQPFGCDTQTISSAGISRTFSKQILLAGELFL